MTNKALPESCFESDTFLSIHGAGARCWLCPSYDDAVRLRTVKDLARHWRDAHGYRSVPNKHIGRRTMRVVSAEFNGLGVS